MFIIHIIILSLSHTHTHTHQQTYLFIYFTFYLFCLRYGILFILYFSLCMYFNLFLSFFRSLPLSLLFIRDRVILRFIYLSILSQIWNLIFIYIFHCIYILVSPPLSLCLFETGLFYNLLSIRLLMCQAKSKLNLCILAWVFMGAHAQFYRKLCVMAHWFLGRLVFGKQYRPRSDAAEQFRIWSGSTLFYWLF